MSYRGLLLAPDAQSFELCQHRLVDLRSYGDVDAGRAGPGVRPGRISRARSASASRRTSPDYAVYLDTSCRSLGCHRGRCKGARCGWDRSRNRPVLQPTSGCAPQKALIGDPDDAAVLLVACVVGSRQHHPARARRLIRHRGMPLSSGRPIPATRRPAPQVRSRRGECRCAGSFLSPAVGEQQPMEQLFLCR